jgi:hypothetical protein
VLISVYITEGWTGRTLEETEESGMPRCKDICPVILRACGRMYRGKFRQTHRNRHITHNTDKETVDNCRGTAIVETGQETAGDCLPGRKEGEGEEKRWQEGEVSL